MWKLQLKQHQKVIIKEKFLLIYLKYCRLGDHFLEGYVLGAITFYQKC
jgi:hypothetical protein